MEKSQRRHWSAEEKLRILEEARQTGSGVSEVCRRHALPVALFYAWEKQARQGALVALQARRRGPKPVDATVQLQAEADRMRAVITELVVENMQLKKGHWA